MAYTAVGHDWQATAVFAVAAVATLARGPVRVTVLVLALLAGNWWASAVMAVSVSAWLYGSRGTLHRVGAQGDSGAATLDALAAEAGRRLAEPLARLGTEAPTVDSLVLLRAAECDDPERWSAVDLTGEPPASHGESERLSRTGWTRRAAEAVLLAVHLPRMTPLPGIHEVALAALLIPGSMTNAWLRAGNTDISSVADQVAGWSEAQLINALAAVAATEEGVALLDHIEACQAAEKHGGRQLGTGHRTFVASATEPASRPEPDASRRLAPASVEEPAEPVQETDEGRPEPDSALEGDCASQDALGHLFRHWRPLARVLWWGVRPLATLTALLACLLVAGPGGRPFPGAVAAAAVVLVRPVRRWWGAIPLICLCAPVSLVAAVAVAVRAAAGMTALAVQGPGTRRGLARLTAARRRALGVPVLRTAWGDVSRALSEPMDLELIDGLFAVGASAWCQADAKVLTATCRDLIRGLLRGRWPSGEAAEPLPSGDTFFLHALAGEALTSWGMRLLAGIGASAVGLLFTDPERVRIGRWDAAPVLAGALSLIASLQWVRRRWPWAIGERHRVAVLLFCFVLGFFVLGAAGTRAVLYGSLAGAAAGLLLQHLSTLRLTPRSLVPRLPLHLRIRPAGGAWTAAAQARSTGRIRVATELWNDLASSAATPCELRGLSLAMIADVALERGDWQKAVETADQAREAMRGARPKSLTDGAVRLLAARVYLSVSDGRTAATLIGSERLLHRRLRRHPTGVALRARALAAVDRVPDALAVLARVRLRARGAQLTDMLEAETLVAAVMGKDSPVAAAARLRSVVELGGADVVEHASSREDGQRMTVVIARAQLALGEALLRADQPEAAETELRKAVHALSAAAEPGNLAVAKVMFGIATAVRRPASESLPLVDEGLRALESLRGVLRRSLLRGGLAVQLEDVYSWALDSLTRMAEAHPAAGETAAVLVESLRRDALATVLRTGAKVLDPDLAQLLSDIDAEEEHAAKQGSGTVGRRDNRERVARLRSDAYATAYLPSTVTMADIRHSAAGAHVLAYRLTTNATGVRGHVVWTPPDAAPRLNSVTITDSEALAALGLRAPEQHDLLVQESQHPGKPATLVWCGLAEALLPASMRAELAHHSTEAPMRLVIVPDGPLTAVPWAGLRLEDGRYLVEAAVVQLTSSLSLIADPDGPGHIPRKQASSHRGGEGRILFHRDAQTPDSTAELLNAVGAVCEARTRPAIQAALNGRDLDGAYFSVHGDATDHGHELGLGDGSILSTDSALGMWWPAWVVFASCIVGRLNLQTGHEPEGLATSCLLGGASTVIAGVVKVEGRVSDRIGVAAAARLAAGRHPAHALREAQLAFLKDRRTASLHRWALFVCITRLAPSEPNMHRSHLYEGLG
ncbi:CHAT domain-containing protein [Streptomyces sp. NBC_00658]|uniref:CHAT domain-containing protein n=1 Tax=Streptomyces sp. NBC_00658 TaxID=2975800 RepID=UPI003247144C